MIAKLTPEPCACTTHCRFPGYPRSPPPPGMQCKRREEERAAAAREAKRSGVGGRDMKRRWDDADKDRRANLRVALSLTLAAILASLAIWVQFRKPEPVAHLSRVVIAPLLEACAAAGGSVELTYTRDEYMDVRSVTCRASRYGK